MPDEAAQPGNLEAFAGRLAAMRPKLHRYLSRMTGSVVDGEDVVQDAMLRAVEAFPTEPAIGNVEAWVFRIAHNRALDLLRRRGHEPGRLEQDVAETMADPAADTEHRLAARAALYTFMRLLPAQRAAVILMDVLGYSLQEIGTVLDCSIPSVKAALHRGRTRLRELSLAPDQPHQAPLDAAELRQLAAYVDRFNARDFDAIRALLAEDVQLDLVGRPAFHGRSEVGGYFGRYASRDDWRLRLGRLADRPAALVCNASGAIVYFILIGWQGAEIKTIRDFRYARYAVDDADLALC